MNSMKQQQQLYAIYGVFPALEIMRTLDSAMFLTRDFDEAKLLQVHLDDHLPVAGAVTQAHDIHEFSPEEILLEGIETQMRALVGRLSVGELTELLLRLYRPVIFDLGQVVLEHTPRASSADTMDEIQEVWSTCMVGPEWPRWEEWLGELVDNYLNKHGERARHRNLPHVKEAIKGILVLRAEVETEKLDEGPDAP
jgi:hypothetical protein